MKQNVVISSEESESKILVAYFSPAENDGVDAVSEATVTSYQGNEMGAAQVLANMIAKNANADLFSIQTDVEYPLVYNDLADYAKDEQDNGVLPTLTTKIENFDSYDTVIVVFPVWWYTMPQAVYSFFDVYDFSGKTVIPATTHAGSYLAGSPATIASLEPNATVIADGFSVQASRVTNAESDVIAWLGKLNLTS
jgi:flavodoxin